jgi:septal ring factor EnvC (AmiA/AmiB activator)
MRCPPDVRTLAALVLALALSAAGAPALAGQVAGDLTRQIRESRERLDEIRAERARLQAEMADVRGRVEDAASDLRNIERQLSASRSVLAEVDFQVEAVTQQVQETTRDLLRTRERSREGSAVLNRRLRDIYKMGGLHTVRVLLGAESFGDLLTRYRYLRMIAAHDRGLVDRVSQLEGALVAQDAELRESLRELGRLRQSQLIEVAQLRTIEEERQRALARFRTEERQTVTRLETLEADEVRLTGLMDDLERRRRDEERRRSEAGRSEGPSTLTPDDLGRLDWPVEGSLTYRFGRQQRPNGTVLRFNGIGIAAPVGTPVTAVRDGTVVLAGPFEGYGPTVVLSHGNGFYTLYLYLEEIGVVEGRTVAAGQVVGTVGGAGTPEGPHIEFQIRAPVGGTAPQALDPLDWLRPGGGR